MQKKKLSPRSLARAIAMQGLYHFIINPKSVSEIEDFLYNHNPELYNQANYELLHFILQHSIEQFDELLDNYTSYLNRQISEINTMEQAIMAIGATELIHNLSVPGPVIINECVELAKTYGAEDSYKFINGLVDKLANHYRTDEIKIYQAKHNTHSDFK